MAEIAESLQEGIRELVIHVCDREEFDEERAFEGLAEASSPKWQRQFVRLLGALASHVPPRETKWMMAHCDKHDEEYKVAFGCLSCFGDACRAREAREGK